MSLEISDLLGPLGGTIALAWAAGAASGFIFCQKIMKARIDFLQAQIEISDSKCDQRLRDMSKRYDAEIKRIDTLLGEYIEQANAINRQIIKDNTK